MVIRLRGIHREFLFSGLHHARDFAALCVRPLLMTNLDLFLSWAVAELKRQQFRDRFYVNELCGADRSIEFARKR